MSDEKLMTERELGEICSTVDYLREHLKAPAGDTRMIVEKIAAGDTRMIVEKIAADDLRRAVKCVKKLQKFVHRARTALRYREGRLMG